MLSTAAAEAAAANWGLCIRLGRYWVRSWHSETEKGVEDSEKEQERSRISSREGAAFRAKGHKVRSVAVPCAHGTVPKDAPAKSKSVTRPETPSVKCPLEVPRRARPPDVRRPVYTTCVCTVLQCGSVDSDEALRLHSAGVLSAACVPGNENEQPCHDAFLSLWPT